MNSSWARRWLWWNARASKTLHPELPKPRFSDRNVLPAKGRERNHSAPSHQGLLCSGPVWFPELLGVFPPLDLWMEQLMLLQDVLLASARVPPGSEALEGYSQIIHCIKYFSPTEKHEEINPWVFNKTSQEAKLPSSPGLLFVFTEPLAVITNIREIKTANCWGRRVERPGWETFKLLWQDILPALKQQWGIRKGVLPNSPDSRVDCAGKIQVSSPRSAQLVPTEFLQMCRGCCPLQGRKSQICSRRFKAMHFLTNLWVSSHIWHLSFLLNQLNWFICFC